MTTPHLIGLLLLAVAGGATWLGRRTTSVGRGLLTWIAYIVSLVCGTTLLVP